MTRDRKEPRWSVEFTRDFAPEFVQMSDPVRQKFAALALILEQLGPQLRRPLVDTLKGSKHSNMKELRFDADGGVWRVAFAFDLRRRAILLVGGDKSGASKQKFYRWLIDIADRRFDRHLDSLKTEQK
jgi:hypothetical protein